MYKKIVCAIAVLTGSMFWVSRCDALDQSGLLGEFSLPDRTHNLLDSHDDYYDALQRLQDADAAVIRAREAAMKDQQSSAEYLAAVKAVDQTYAAYIDKKNALVADLQKKDPVYNQMKSQVAAVDAQIESALQNPGTTQEHFDELYKNRETFLNQWHQIEKDASDRAGLAPLLQQWIDASQKLADLQARQCAQVENTEKLKAAIATAEDAKNSVEQARMQISGPGPAGKLTSQEQGQASDYLCRYTQAGIAGNDAWWTYGWNVISGNGSTSAPGR